MRTQRYAAIAAAAVAGLVLFGGHRVMRDAVASPGAAHGVWVFFDAQAAGSTLPPAVSQEVLDRRGPLDGDRPVNPDLVRQLADAGATVRYVSRWLRAASVDADAAALRGIAAIPEVTRIVPIRSAYPAAANGMHAGASTGSAAAATDTAFYGATLTALRELNIPVLHTLGFTGAASRIAILDTGFYLEHETLATRRIVAQRDFINHDGDAGSTPGAGDGPDQARHGTMVFSLLGGHAPGRLVGGAYNAAFHLAKVDVAGLDTEADEDRWVAAVEWADSLGARIINSSIGFRSDFTDRPPIPYGDLDGNTTVTTRMADEAARRGVLIVQAVGNEGPAPGSLWAPADADSVLVAGAMDSVTALRVAVPTTSSSRGPTADGRTRPHVVARGAGLTAAGTLTPTHYETGLAGSSFATPFIAAGAALLWEAWPSLSAMAVRDAIRDAGSSALQPDNAVGWGAPDIAAAVMFPQGILLTQNSLTPTDLQGNVTTITPTFRWTASLVHPLMQPVTYHIQIARDSLFQNIVFSDTVRDASAYTARAPLRPIARAWWRVVAVSPQGIRRGTAPRPSFSVPPWVRLLSLAEPEPEFTSELRPELSWAPLAAPAPVGPFTYRVQVLSAAGAVLQDMQNITTSSVRVPQALTPNQSYRWRVIAITRSGPADTVETAVPFVVISDEAPPATIVYQNFPNPFGAGAARTNIWFDLAQDGAVQLAVYDLRGRLVRQLIPAQPGCGTITLRAGLYGRPGAIPNGVASECVLLEWDGADHSGQRVPRGVYLLRLRAGGVDDIRRMLYLPH
jgi:hypothetical protein